MFKSLFLASLCCLCSLLFGQKHITPLINNGALTVKNGLIVNRLGVPPQLHGISFSWSVWQGQKYYNPAVVDWLTTDFKVDIIRLAMAVEPDSGYLQQPKFQQQLIENLVDRAITDGIYVLIDWHDHHSSKHIEQAKTFFAAMAKKYNGKPNVIYEIWNEPERIGWDTVKNYAVKLITEIRKYDTNNLIVVGSPHWDQDVDIVAADAIVGFDNIAYSFHFYASDPNHQAGLRERANKAIKMGLPLIVTEWGVGESNGNGVFDKTENETWLKWLAKNKLSWVTWNLTDKQETTALLMPHASKNGRWKTNELTPSGSYIRQKLQQLSGK